MKRLRRLRRRYGRSHSERLRAFNPGTRPIDDMIREQDRRRSAKTMPIPRMSMNEMVAQERAEDAKLGHALARCPTGSRVQSLLFPTSRFTVESAKAWARKHDWHFNDVDVKPEFIHLRQEDPAHFSRMRTVYLGGRGVQARVGWGRC